MNSPAISVEGIGKLYQLARQSDRHASFREALMAMALAPVRRFRQLRGTDAAMEDFWALRDVSFTVQPGEVVGIIGRNGAGKSTLLKILSRIVEPTEGRAVMRGRIASLLEVGTGFHPELSGRENVYLNGSILGMKRREIAAKFDDIVAFAEVEKFLDTPVKRYSSGMYVRLAFAVAAHLEPEILIVDEVLAVGDIQFQKKCLGKMGDVSRSGRTVLFVSHNMAAVRQLTTRCIVMKSGSVVFDGEPERAIDLYSDLALSEFIEGDDLSTWPRPPYEMSRGVTFKALRFPGHAPLFESGEDVVFEAKALARDSLPAVRISGTINQADGAPIGSFFCADSHPTRAGVAQTFRVVLSGLRLAPGMYSMGLALGQGNELTGHRDFDIVLDVLPFEIGPLRGEGGTLGNWAKSWGALRLPAPRQEEISSN